MSDAPTPKTAEGLIADQLIQIINAPPHKMAEVLAKLWFTALEQSTAAHAQFRIDEPYRNFIEALIAFVKSIEKRQYVNDRSLMGKIVFLGFDPTDPENFKPKNVEKNDANYNVVSELANSFIELANSAGEKLYSSPDNLLVGGHVNVDSTLKNEVSHGDNGKISDGRVNFSKAEVPVNDVVIAKVEVSSNNTPDVGLTL